MALAFILFIFTCGVIIGLCLGYWRLSRWFEVHTGKNLWREVERARGKLN